MAKKREIRKRINYKVEVSFSEDEELNELMFYEAVKYIYFKDKRGSQTSN